MRSKNGHPIVAAMLDWSMRPMQKIRARVVPAARGRVLEVGVGTGMNLADYNAEGVSELVGIEPDPHMLRRARRRFETAPFPTQLIQAGAEDLPFDDNAFEQIVVTFTLCTIPDTRAALAEMHRVLVPGGLLHFAEHTRSDHAPMAKLQSWIDPVWKRLAGGCHLDRDAVSMLADARFEVGEVFGHGRTPWNLTPVHRGVATKSVVDQAGLPPSITPA